MLRTTAFASGTKGRSRSVVEGQAQSTPPSRAGRRRGGLRRYRLGTRGLAVFAALVVLGLLAWLAGSPGISSRLFGVNLGPLSPPDDPAVLSLFFTPLVCGALALAAGLAFPRGFYLWGIALNLHAPFAQALTVYLMEREGVDWSVGGSGGYVAFLAVLFVFTTLLYTALSALGMGARRLSGRVIRR